MSTVVNKTNDYIITINDESAPVASSSQIKSYAYMAKMVYPPSNDAKTITSDNDNINKSYTKLNKKNVMFELTGSLKKLTINVNDIDEKHAKKQLGQSLPPPIIPSNSGASNICRNKIIRRKRNRIRNFIRNKCPKCNYPNIAPFKFCKKCSHDKAGIQHNQELQSNVTTTQELEKITKIKETKKAKIQQIQINKDNGDKEAKNEYTKSVSNAHKTCNKELQSIKLQYHKDAFKIKKETIKKLEKITKIKLKKFEQLEKSNKSIQDLDSKTIIRYNEMLDNILNEYNKRIMLLNRNADYDNDEKYDVNNKILIKRNSGLVGLQNIGLTCWMNSVLQSMSHLPKIIEYFKCNHFTNQNKISKSYKNILNNIWRWDQNSNASNSLYQFKNALSYTADIYKSNTMQDPAEFLDYLINGLHSELNTANDEYANNDLIVGNGLPDKMVSILSWTAYLKSHKSPIIDFFYGQHKSSVICSNKQCNYNYVIFEPFKILPVSTILPKKFNMFNRKINIYQCIDYYFSKNRLENKWYCSQCKTDQLNCSEQIQLYKFPQILIIQLKKLKMQNISDQQLVNYPVNDYLDLSKYDIADKKQQKYKLFAVTCLSAYHCIAYCKNYLNQKWFCFNDSSVTEVKKEDVVVQDAYLLFYQKISN